jgi:hypothetical protein
MDAFRLLSLVKFLVNPQHRDHPQADISGIGSTDGIESSKLHQTGKCFSQEGVTKMSDMEGMVGIGLGILDHHPLTFGLASPKISTLLKDGVHQAFGIFS